MNIFATLATYGLSIEQASVQYNSGYFDRMAGYTCTGKGCGLAYALGAWVAECRMYAASGRGRALS